MMLFKFIIESYFNLISLFTYQLSNTDSYFPTKNSFYFHKNISIKTTSKMFNDNKNTPYYKNVKSSFPINITPKLNTDQTLEVYSSFKLTEVQSPKLDTFIKLNNPNIMNIFDGYNNINSKGTLKWILELSLAHHPHINAGLKYFW